jgi:hypothetical protein
MTKSTFLICLILQLACPAIVYLMAGFISGRQHLNIAYLLPNYLYMAAPHFLVALCALIPNFQRSTLLWLLTLLNGLLIAFYNFMFGTVPNDSGFAWLLYIPLCVLALAFALLFKMIFMIINKKKLP